MQLLYGVLEVLVLATHVEASQAHATTPRLRSTGTSIRYEYEFNRLSRVDYPVSTDVEYRYGPPGAAAGGAGRVVEVVDDVGVEKREYGPLGEVTKQTRQVRPLRPGDRAATYTLGFEWDSFGRLLGLEYPDGERLAYEYDEGGLVTKATGVLGGETTLYLASVEYDEFGQRVRAVAGNGVETRYRYEEDTRRLESLRARLSPVTGGTVFQAMTYGYDAVGNVTALTNALPSPLATAYGGSVGYQYAYDDGNRLVGARGEAETRPGVRDVFEAGWGYSDIHNVTRATLARKVVSLTGTEAPPADTRDEGYTYDATAGPHRAVRIGETSLKYDEDGNTTEECEGTACAPGQGRAYTWDEAGQLAEARASGRLVRFRYDGDGQRQVKLSSGGASFNFGQWWAVKGNAYATKHIFVGAARVATRLLPAATVQANTAPPDGSSTSAWPNDFGCVPSGNQPQKCPTNASGTAWVERGVVRPAVWYYHSDALGSTQWLTDEEGQLAERVEYYPYGEVWRQVPRHGPAKLKQAFLYTGKEYDEETGLTYFGARYYDSRRARWLSPDPALGAFVEQFQAQQGPLRGHLGAPGNLNVYSYGLGSPVTLRDEDGNFPWLVAAFVALAWSLPNHEDEPQPIAGTDRYVPAGNSALTMMAPPYALANGVGQVALARDAQGEQRKEHLINAAASLAGAKLGFDVMTSGPGLKTLTQTTTLYRAVSEAEFAQIQKTGKFQAGPNSLGGKWFAESQADAAKWGDILNGKGNSRIVETTLLKSSADQFMRLDRLDGIGPARYGELEQLNGAVIREVK